MKFSKRHNRHGHRSHGLAGETYTTPFPSSIGEGGLLARAWVKGHTDPAPPTDDLSVKKKQKKRR